MTVAITGASGFVGTHLLKKLSSKKQLTIRLFDRNHHSLFDTQSLKKLVQHCDVIYHLAGKQENSLEALAINLLGTLHLLEAVTQFAKPSCHIIFSSSFAVYKIPKKGETITEKFPCKPSGLYGISKLQAEQLIQKYCKNGRTATVFRIGNIYGPGMQHGKKGSAIANFFYAITSQTPITIRGDGNQARDYMYIDDVVDILVSEMKRKKRKLPLSYDMINLCSGTSTCLNDIITLLQTVTNRQLTVQRIKSNERSAHWQTNNTKMTSLFSLPSFTSITDGLTKTWHEQNE